MSHRASKKIVSDEKRKEYEEALDNLQPGVSYPHDLSKAAEEETTTTNLKELHNCLVTRPALSTKIGEHGSLALQSAYKWYWKIYTPIAGCYIYRHPAGKGQNKVALEEGITQFTKCGSLAKKMIEIAHENGIAPEELVTKDRKELTLHGFMAIEKVAEIANARVAELREAKQQPPQDAAAVPDTQHPAQAAAATQHPAQGAATTPSSAQHPAQGAAAAALSTQQPDTVVPSAPPTASAQVPAQQQPATSRLHAASNRKSSVQGLARLRPAPGEDVASFPATASKGPVSEDDDSVEVLESKPPAKKKAKHDDEAEVKDWLMKHLGEVMDEETIEQYAKSFIAEDFTMPIINKCFLKSGDDDKKRKILRDLGIKRGPAEALLSAISDDTAESK